MLGSQEYCRCGKTLEVVVEVLQRGVFEGVLGMLLHKGCMKDVTVLQSYIFLFAFGFTNVIRFRDIPEETS